MRNILITIFLLLLPLTSNARDFSYRLMPTIKTSASDELRCLYFDHLGMMWIGTNSGLKSFDGYTSRTYRSDAFSPNIFPNNSVMAITEDKTGCLWIGTHNGIVRMNRLTGQYKTYFLPNTEQRIVYTLFTSRNGTVWAGTDKGLSFYNPHTDTFHSIDNSSKTMIVDANGKRHPLTKNYSVKAIIEDSHGNLFVGTWNNGLIRYQLNSNTFYCYPLINGETKAYSLYLDHQQRLWIGTWGRGIVMMNNPYDFAKPQIQSFYNGTEEFSTYYKIIEDPVTSSLWACSREGISILNLKDIHSGFTNYTHTGDVNTQNLGFNTDMITDGTGNIWLETTYDGIIQINTTPSIFSVYHINTDKTRLRINSVGSIFTDDGNLFFLGLKPFGLSLYNRTTGNAAFGKDIPGLQNINSKMMNATFSSIVKRFNGEVWFANNSYGIMVVKHGIAATARNRSNSPFISDDYVTTLYQAANRVMWIGQRIGVGIAYPDNSGTTLKMAEGKSDFSNCEVRGITGDSKGNIWISTENDGILRVSGNPYRPTTLRYHQYNPERHNYAVDDATNCFEDSHHRLWAISRSGGLFRYDATDDKFIPVNRDYHIDGDKVFAINEDRYGNLWLTTDMSLIRLSFIHGNIPDVTNFSDNDGLESILQQPNATCQYGDELFFGSRNSFFSFVPVRSFQNKFDRKIQLIVTDLIVDDKNFLSLDSTLAASITTMQPTFTHKITIPSDVEKFSIEFALLSYSNPEQTKYAYKLEGYDKEWRYRDASLRRATFENLPSGTYHLHLKAANNYGKWFNMPYTITIRVLPPFYATWWAFVIYLFIIIGIIYGIVLWYRNHLKTKNRLQMAVIFTNITHELLTPLTVISATVDDLKDKAPQYEDHYNMVQGNIQRLTKMLRQILEVRKSQAGQLRLLVSQSDIADFVRKESLNMMPILEKKNIALHINCPQEHIKAYFDPDKLDKIIYNLLSNAVKYTNEQGRIDVSLDADDKQATLVISDNGIGISKAKMKSLYQRFLDGDYRRMNTIGTGIGLSLTHDLVLLHHGHIDCKSEIDKGTTFTISLPINRYSYSDKEIDKNEKSKAKSADRQTISEISSMPNNNTQDEKNPDEDCYRLLIVEDNEELLELMRKLLCHQYQVFTAKNGQQALNVINHEELDIVITDVMMPIMDGLELTRKIKNNPDFAQLPVVMLTAMTRDEDRNAAYATGADEYITKPFKLDDLLLRINNIIANRERVRSKFSRQTHFEIAEQHYSNPDETFIAKALECVMNHLDDADYDRDHFAADMCASSSSLYNKLRALTGQSVTGFINSIRLKEACRIARANPSIPITELSLQVGFNTPKYFTKCFKKEFGMLLKEYLEQPL